MIFKSSFNIECWYVNKSFWLFSNKETSKQIKYSFQPSIYFCLQLFYYSELLVNIQTTTIPFVS